MLRLHMLIAGALLTLSGGSFAAQTLAGPSEVRAFADTVMSKVVTSDFDGAASEMKKYTIVPDAEVDATFGQFKLQLSGITQRFGASAGTEFIKQEQVGTSLLRLTYLHRFERHPMRWVFYFYRGNSGWFLDTFQANDSIAPLFP